MGNIGKNARWRTISEFSHAVGSWGAPRMNKLGIRGRRDFLKFARIGVTSVAAAPLSLGVGSRSVPSASGAAPSSAFDVRTYGGSGDGKTLDTPANTSPIESAAAAGGRTLRIPTRCDTIH